MNIGKILSLQPDLIIANKEENQKEDIEELAQHCPVYVTDIKTLEDAISKNEVIGEITSTTDKAGLINQTIRQRFEKLSLEGSKPRVAYLIWKSPIMVAGGDTYINDMLEKAGFENVFKHLCRYPTVDEAELQAADIEYIFLSSEPFPFKNKHLEYFEQIIPLSLIHI